MPLLPGEESPPIDQVPDETEQEQTESDPVILWGMRQNSVLRIGAMVLTGGLVGYAIRPGPVPLAAGAASGLAVGLLLERQLKASLTK
jgi:hypothetical protein